MYLELEKHYLNTMFSEQLKQNYPLADLSTFKIGGNAEYFAELTTKEEVEAAFAWAKEQGLAITVLGGGSNILISDAGVKGLVVRPHNQILEFSELSCVCGTSIEVRQLAEAAFDKTLSGIEWSIGIPGSVGGAIRGNAGAHGGSFDKVVDRVIVFDAENFSWNSFAKEECAFTYRTSRFKLEPHYIIWEIHLSLSAGDRNTMKQAMDEYREYRRTSQPKEPSAGCIFKNLFAVDVEKQNADLYQQALSDNKVRGGKIGAGYLVQRLGLKGLSNGGAKISEQHANFIVNADHASSEDVSGIIAVVKEKVKNQFNIELEEEVQRLGF